MEKYILCLRFALLITIKQIQMKKIFKLAKVNSRNGKTTQIDGTLEELIERFSYTLEVGESWQHEKGNKKINRNPRGIKSLINNINNAVDNSACNGCGSYYVELID